RRGRQLKLGDFAGLKSCGGGILSSGGLEHQVQKGNEALVHRPGNLLTIQTEGGHKELSGELRSLEKERRPFFGEYKRHGLGRFEGRIFRNLDFHQVAVVGREEWVENRMIE